MPVFLLHLLRHRSYDVSIITGSIQTRNWEDNDGKKHYVTEVVADGVYFCESKRPSDGGRYATTEAGYNDDDMTEAYATESYWDAPF